MLTAFPASIQRQLRALKRAWVYDFGQGVLELARGKIGTV